MKKDLAEALAEFSKESPAISLSTVSLEGQPQCSLVYFAVDENTDILFFSKEETRKSRNIELNPKVALMAYHEQDEKILQMEGQAKRIEGEKEKAKAFSLIVKAMKGRVDWPPPAGKIFGGDLALYKITLDWARLGHFKQNDSDLFTNLLP